MCETHVRSIDCRRLARQRVHKQEPRKQDAQKNDKDYSSGSDSSSSCSNSSGQDQPQHFGKTTRESAKASFLAKVFNEVIGYGSDYELIAFQYDLWL